MKTYFYKGNKVIEYAPRFLIGFYYDSSYNIHQTCGHSLEEIKQNLDKYDQRSKMS